MIKYSALLPTVDQNKDNVALFDTVQQYEQGTLGYLFNKLKKWITKDFVDVEDYLDYAYQFGFDITYLSGYSSTLKYLEKEKITLIPRLLNRSNPKSYQYIFYIFNLKGNVYPLLKTEEEDLAPFTSFLTFPGFIDVEQTLDRDQDDFGIDIDTIQTLDEGEDEIDYYLKKTLDSGSNLDIEDTLDELPGIPHAIIPATLSNWTLDIADVYGAITRHILLAFRIQFGESSTHQITGPSWLALHGDVKQNKRLVEVPHYQLSLPLNGLKVQNKLYTESVYDEEMNILSSYESVNIGNLNTAHRVYLGSGEYTGNLLALLPASNPITTPLKNFLISDQKDISKSIPQFLFKNHIYENTRIFNTSDTILHFSEIAVKDSSNNLLFYCRFPKIEINPTVFHTFDFQFNLRD